MALASSLRFQSCTGFQARISALDEKYRIHESIMKLLNKNLGAHFRKCTMQVQAGFTLIELLMVLAIIGILASLSVGQYTRHIEQSNRRAAVSSLYTAQQMMERVRLQNGVYVELDAGQISSLQDQSQRYRISSVVTATTYIVSAIPPANAPDVACGTMSISNSDVRTSTGTAPLNECWQ